MADGEFLSALKDALDGIYDVNRDSSDEDDDDEWPTEEKEKVHKDTDVDSTQQNTEQETNEESKVCKLRNTSPP